MKSTRKYLNPFSIGLIVFIGLNLVTYGVVEYREYKSNEYNKVIHDILFGTNTSSSKYAEDKKNLADIYDDLLSFTSDLTLTYEKFINSDALEARSYENESSMNEIIEVVSQYKSALEDYEKNVSDVKVELAKKMNESAVSSMDEEDVSDFFDRPSSITLNQKRSSINNATINYLELIEKLYLFTLSKYGQYSIIYDKDAEYNVDFFAPSNEENFMDLVRKINTIQIEIDSFTNEYYEFAQQYADSYDLDLNVDELY